MNKGGQCVYRLSLLGAFDVESAQQISFTISSFVIFVVHRSDAKSAGLIRPAFCLRYTTCEQVVCCSRADDPAAGLYLAPLDFVATFG